MTGDRRGPKTRWIASARAVRAHLAFFAEHSRYVELLIQERALFKDRRQSTYFQHRDAYAERWRELYRGLIAAGRVRPMPIERIRAVITDLLYGTMFTNYFTGRRHDPAEQARRHLRYLFPRDPQRFGTQAHELEA